MATPHRPGRTSCTNGTAERSGSTECTQCARHPVHDSFHDQLAASGSRITLSDGVQITLSDGAVIRFRAIDLPASDYLGRQASRRCATVSTVTTCFWSSTVYSARYSPGLVTHMPSSGESSCLPRRRGLTATGPVRCSYSAAAAGNGSLARARRAAGANTTTYGP